MNSRARKRRRAQLFVYQHGHCRWCRCRMVEFDESPRSCTIDHLIPVSRGGTDHWSNTVGACKACNVEKGDMTADEYRAFKAAQHAAAA